MSSCYRSAPTCYRTVTFVRSHFTFGIQDLFDFYDVYLPHGLLVARREKLVYLNIIRAPIHFVLDFDCTLSHVMLLCISSQVADRSLYKISRYKRCGILLKS